MSEGGGSEVVREEDMVMWTASFLRCVENLCERRTLRYL